MAEIEELCDEVAFIRKGRVVARGSPEALKAQFRFRFRVTLRILEAPATVELPEDHSREGDLLKFEVERLETLGEIVTRLARKGASIREIRVEEPDLEEVFVELAKEP
jgi:ABC-2 type transport system ATP-binding protein